MYLEPLAVIGGERYQTLNQVITITFLFFNLFWSLGWNHRIWSSIGDPKILVGDLKIFIGDPNFFSGNTKLENWGLKQKVWSLMKRSRGSSMKSLGSSLKVYGLRLKSIVLMNIWGSPMKSWCIRLKSDKNRGVSDSTPMMWYLPRLFIL